MGRFHPFFKENAIYLYGEMNMIPAIACASLMFLGFKNWKARQSKIVNCIAGCTFGVYLLHDHPNIREFLWVKVFRSVEYLYDKTFLFRIILSILSVFVIGIAVDLFRQNVIKGLSRYVNFKNHE